MKIIVAGRGELFVQAMERLKEERLSPMLKIIYGQRQKYEWISGIETIVAKRITPAILEARKPDLLVLVGYPQILDSSIFSIPKFGTINLHTSKLPEYRGRHPVNWALIRGEPEVGITAHFISERIDAGDIILQDSVAVKRDDDLNSLQRRLIPKACDVLVAAIIQIKAGCAYRRKQNEALSTILPKRTPKDSRVNWRKSASELTVFINALVHPMPQAFAKRRNGKPVRFIHAHRGSRVGEVICKSGNRYIIAAKDAPILVSTDRVLRIGEVLH